MSTETERDEMLPEYDFTDGVRGKYVSRLEGKREEILRGARALDSQAWLAHSLLSVQAFESRLVAYWALALDEEPEKAGRNVSSLLESHDKRSLKTLRKDLHKHTSVEKIFFEELSRLIEDRNWLVHRSFMSLSHPRLQSITDRSMWLSNHMTSLLVERCSSMGMEPSEIETKADEVVEQWAGERNAA